MKELLDPDGTHEPPDIRNPLANSLRKEVSCVSPVLTLVPSPSPSFPSL